ncbi:unnamed protein product [Linum trigynum]|uniref:Uncharacterized protein n=1 Tax=Linum trigynum TaxID=586398 RepID=A0AAV2F915_9ROSI
MVEMRICAGEKKIVIAANLGLFVGLKSQRPVPQELHFLFVVGEFEQSEQFRLGGLGELGSDPVAGELEESVFGGVERISSVAEFN